MLKGRFFQLPITDSHLCVGLTATGGKTCPNMTLAVEREVTPNFDFDKVERGLSSLELIFSEGFSQNANKKEMLFG